MKQVKHESAKVARCVCAHAKVEEKCRSSRLRMWKKCGEKSPIAGPEFEVNLERCKRALTDTNGYKRPEKI